MNVQINRFSNGGFCVHKAQFSGRRYSAWYDRSGRLLDCERTDGPHPVSVPRRHANVRAGLERIGRMLTVSPPLPCADAEQIVRMVAASSLIPADRIRDLVRADVEMIRPHVGPVTEAGLSLRSATRVASRLFPPPPEAPPCSNSSEPS